MRKAHIVTGGTGFVGLGLILELLRQTEADIVCLVRPGKEAAATRLYRLLREATLAYTYDEEILQAISQRCHVIEGDIREERCGIHSDLPYTVEQFWHCAASLQYRERDAAKIWSTNVEGTKQALALARHHRATAFNYISTAYVAGKRTGTILEAIESGHETCNFYERTKIQAEAMVSQVTDMHVRIFRPSIVIGHSQTHAVVGSFTGLYGLMHQVHFFKKALSKKMVTDLDEELLHTTPLHMCVDPTLGINFIPIDWVATQAIQCATSSSGASIFHLTNSTPPSLGPVLQHIFSEFGLPEPIFVERIDGLSGQDAQFAQITNFYTSYMTGNKLFDRTNTNRALGRADSGDCILKTEKLVAFYRWYLAYLQRQSGQRALNQKTPEVALKGV